MRGLRDVNRPGPTNGIHFGLNSPGLGGSRRARRALALNGLLAFGKNRTLTSTGRVACLSGQKRT